MNISYRNQKPLFSLNDIYIEGLSQDCSNYYCSLALSRRNAYCSSRHTHICMCMTPTDFYFSSGNSWVFLFNHSHCSDITWGSRVLSHPYINSLYPRVALRKVRLLEIPGWKRKTRFGSAASSNNSNITKRPPFFWTYRHIGRSSCDYLISSTRLPHLVQLTISQHWFW